MSHSKKLKQYMKKEYGMNMNDWEEVPQEDLWQDGEIKEEEVAWEMFRRVAEIGDWKLIREKDENQNEENKLTPMCKLPPIFQFRSRKNYFTEYKIEYWKKIKN